jgi:mono/diheme cytochrome c family protein
LVVDFLHNNSANFDGLNKLEDIVKDIAPPTWPWLIDNNLAARGKAIFARSKAEGGCIECHGITAGPARFPNQQT